MKLSGYNGAFRSKVIAEGLRGHMKKVAKSLRMDLQSTGQERKLEKQSQKGGELIVNGLRTG